MCPHSFCCPQSSLLHILSLHCNISTVFIATYPQFLLLYVHSLHCNMSTVFIAACPQSLPLIVYSRMQHKTSFLYYTSPSGSLSKNVLSYLCITVFISAGHLNSSSGPYFVKHSESTDTQNAAIRVSARHVGIRCLLCCDTKKFCPFEEVTQKHFIFTG